MFFFLNKRYPMLKPVAGLAALLIGVVVHSVVLMAGGAVLTLIALGSAAISLRRRGIRGGRGPDRSLR